MASITKHKDQWRVQVYVGGSRLSKVLPTESSARTWAARQEGRLRQKSELRKLIDMGLGVPNFPQRIVQAIQDAPLTYQEVTDGSIPASVTCGIYFLIRAEKIVYVGQSTNVLRRISRHMDNRVEFDSFSITPCQREQLNELEAIYITAFYPHLNTSLGAKPRGIVARMPSPP